LITKSSQIKSVIQKEKQNFIRQQRGALMRKAIRNIQIIILSFFMLFAFSTITIAGEEKNNVKQTKKMPDKIIGVWFGEEIGEVTIIKKGSGFIIKRIIMADYKYTETLIAYKVNEKQAFKEKGNKFGEYYLIEKSGDLGVYSPAGLFTVMRKIK
jgi:hypothetical protein